MERKTVTIKIKAPKAWTRDGLGVAMPNKYSHDDMRVRIVRESDWRRLMKLVRACEEYIAGCERVSHCPYALIDAIDALKEKKK